MEFELTKWKNHPTEVGIVVLENTCTYQELHDALKAYLSSRKFDDEYSVFDWLDYLHIDLKTEKKNIPVFRRIYCWVVAGSNEGHYFHIDCETVEGENVNLLIAKTLSGNIENALLINTEICRFLLNVEY